MLSLLAAWPPSALLTALALMGTSLAWPASRLWALYVRRSERSLDLVDLLRVALDKGRVRENAAMAVCEILQMALEMALHTMESPPPAIRHAIERAAEIIRSAVQSCAETDRRRP